MLHTFKFGLTGSPTLPNSSNGVGLVALATHCTQLQQMSVCNNDNVTDAALVALAQTGSAHLRTLQFNRCISVSATCIETLATNCRSLHTLDLANMNAISEQCLRTIVSHLKNVRVLGLSCSGAGDATMAIVAQHMSQLERLTLTGDYIHMYTPAGIDRITSMCENLKYLDLDGTHRNLLRQPPTKKTVH